MISVIRELIISFDYHSGKTVKKLRKLELEKKNTTDEDELDNLKKEIDILQSDYESKLKPVALEIAFNIHYLISVLEKLTSQDVSMVIPGGENKSCLLNSIDDESYQYIIMPMKI